MNTQQMKQQGWETAKEHWKLAMLITLCFYGLTGVVPMIWEVPMNGGFQTWLVAETITPESMIVSMIYSILLLPLTYGLYVTYLDMMRKEDVTVISLFQGFQNGNYPRVLVTVLLQSVYLLLWALLLIIPSIIKALAYSQTYYILKDHPHLTANAAITRSREMMNGNKGHYFLFLLSFIGWFFLAIVTLGLALFWVIPYLSSSMAAYYEQLKASSEERDYVDTNEEDDLMDDDSY